AHAAMLQHIGILNEEEHKSLHKALCTILEMEAENAFTIQPSDEDVHTSVENYLSTQVGAAGKKIHTARSRNDQVQVDIRLYSKEQLNYVSKKLLTLCDTLLQLAKAYEY